MSVRVHWIFLFYKADIIALIFEIRDKSDARINIYTCLK